MQEPLGCIVRPPLFSSASVAVGHGVGRSSVAGRSSAAPVAARRYPVSLPFSRSRMCVYEEEASSIFVFDGQTLTCCRCSGRRLTVPIATYR